MRFVRYTCFMSPMSLFWEVYIFFQII
jgi:hypothetical protein